jgi:hypothetical protein
VRGRGRGGRNQELVLAAAPAIGRLGAPAVVASAGTAGIDGPTAAAGALADTTTVDRGRAAGLPDITEALEANDSHTWLTRLGDTIVTRSNRHQRRRPPGRARRRLLSREAVRLAPTGLRPCWSGRIAPEKAALRRMMRGMR